MKRQGWWRCLLCPDDHRHPSPCPAIEARYHYYRRHYRRPQ